MSLTQKTCSVVALFIFLLSCGQQADEKKNSSMREQSELAALMRAMEAHGDEVIMALERGDPLPEPPAGIDGLVDAEPTPNMNIHEGSFPAFIEQYRSSIRLLYAAEVEDRNSAFNAVIRSCDNCHRMNCPGPLMKIEKMYISE